MHASIRDIRGPGDQRLYQLGMVQWMPSHLTSGNIWHPSRECESRRSCFAAVFLRRTSCSCFAGGALSLLLPRNERLAAAFSDVTRSCCDCKHNPCFPHTSPPIIMGFCIRRGVRLCYCIIQSLAEKCKSSVEHNLNLIILTTLPFG